MRNSLPGKYEGFGEKKYSGWVKESQYVPGFDAVSYTHLDVYKRQGVDAHDGRPVSIGEIWDAVKDLHNENRIMEGVW